MGVITALDKEEQLATVTVDMFGQDTPLEVSFTDIKKL